MALRWMGLLTDRYYRPHWVPRAQFLRSLRDGTVCVELWVQLCIQCSMERSPRLNSFNWNKTLYWPCVRFHIFVFTASLSYWRLGFTSCYARRIVLTASDKYLAAITRKEEGNRGGTFSKCLTPVQGGHKEELRVEELKTCVLIC